MSSNLQQQQQQQRSSSSISSTQQQQQRQNEVITATAKSNREDPGDTKDSKSPRIPVSEPRGMNGSRSEESPEAPSSKVIRTTGESQGALTRDIEMQESFVNGSGMVVDAIEEVSWCEKKGKAL